MGAPIIVGDTTGSPNEPSDIVTGDLDDVNFRFPNDTWSIISGPSYGVATIDASTGEWSYDLDETHPAYTALDPGEELDDLFTVQLTDTGGTDTQVVTITLVGVTCFAEGTLIETDRGKLPVESLVPGDRLRTMDHGLQELEWVGRRVVDASGDLAPICFTAGTMGNERDLLVSPQHRMLITGWRAELIAGENEVLVAAKHLVNGDTIYRQPRESIRYFHLMFADHGIIFAENLPTESFYSGGDAAKTIPGLAEELSRLYPETPAGRSPEVLTARPVLTAREACLLGQIQ